MSTAAERKPIPKKRLNPKRRRGPRMSLDELLEQVRLPKVTRPKEVKRELMLIFRKFPNKDDIEKLERIETEMLEQGVVIRGRPIPVKDRAGEVIEYLSNCLFFGMPESKIPGTRRDRRDPKKRKKRGSRKKKESDLSLTRRRQ